VAWSLVQRFAASRSGGSRLDTRDFDAAFDGATVIARADDVIATGAGTVVARVVRTGHRTSTSGQSISDAAFHIATAASLPGCLVEVLHLSEDEPATVVSFEPRALGKHRSARAGSNPTGPSGHAPPAPRSSYAAASATGRSKKIFDRRYRSPDRPAIYLLGRRNSAAIHRGIK
jgi:hypothetical protein